MVPRVHCLYTVSVYRLQIPGLDIESKYKLLIERFEKDLQFVQKEYNEQRESPPVARNLPPVSGRIAWCRQLYRRLKEPVDAFQSRLDLMALAETRKVIKSYNRLAKILVEYEVVFLRLWNRQVDETRALLNSTVLVRNPDSGQLLVNIDKRVMEMFRDIQVLQGMNIEVPKQGLTLYSQKQKFMERFNAIEVSVYIDTWMCTNACIYMKQPLHIHLLS